MRDCWDIHKPTAFHWWSSVGTALSDPGPVSGAATLEIRVGGRFAVDIDAPGVAPSPGFVIELRARVDPPPGAFRLASSGSFDGVASVRVEVKDVARVGAPGPGLGGQRGKSQGQQGQFELHRESLLRGPPDALPKGRVAEPRRWPVVQPPRLFYKTPNRWPSLKLKQVSSPPGVNVSQGGRITLVTQLWVEVGHIRPGRDFFGGISDVPD